MNKSAEFSYEELANATNNFSLANKIGQGGFGEVYYAELRGEVCNLMHCLLVRMGGSFVKMDGSLSVHPLTNEKCEANHAPAKEFSFYK